jgi:hypothetical protein
MQNSMLIRGLFIATVLLLTGCVAPEVRKGAELLASFTHQVSEEGINFVQSRTSLAQARQANIAMLELNAAELENSVNRDIAVWELSEADGKRRAEIMKGIRKIANDSSTLRAEMEDLRKKHEASIASAKSAVELRQKELSAVTKTLTSLSQSPDLQSEIKFFTGYFKEVKKGIDEAKDASAENAKAAKEASKKKLQEINKEKISSDDSKNLK